MYLSTPLLDEPYNPQKPAMLDLVFLNPGMSLDDRAKRPLRWSDFEALGEAAPIGPILGARVPDVGAKEALLADDGEIYFTTPHFEGYPATLVQIDNISKKELEELVMEAWLTQAPKHVSRQGLAAREGT